MKTHEFFQKYANTPFKERAKFIFSPDDMALCDVYLRIHELEDIMRPMRIERDELLRKVEGFL